MIGSGQTLVEQARGPGILGPPPERLSRFPFSEWTAHLLVIFGEPAGDFLPRVVVLSAVVESPGTYRKKSNKYVYEKSEFGLLLPLG